MRRSEFDLRSHLARERYSRAEALGKFLFIEPFLYYLFYIFPSNILKFSRPCVIMKKNYQVNYMRI